MKDAISSMKTELNLLTTALVTVLAASPALAQYASPRPHVAQQVPARPKSPPPAAPRQAPQPAAPVAAAPATPAPAAPAGRGSGNDVIARVGNADVTADDIRAYVAKLDPREQAALARDPTLLSQAVRLLLANRLVLQEVAAKKWDQQPSVAAQLDRVRENAVVELYLQSVSVPPASFPSEDDLQKVYDANRAAFLMPRQFQLAQIFIALPEGADKSTEEQARKRLDEVERKLKAPGTDFAAIAAAENDAKDGGELGWVAENQVRPEIRTQVMGLAKNAISDPIKLDDGWHILRLIDTKAAYTRTLPEVREQLIPQVRAERSQMLRRAYLGELLKQHPPVLNELALSNLLDNGRK